MYLFAMHSENAKENQQPTARILSNQSEDINDSCIVETIVIQQVPFDENNHPTEKLFFVPLFGLFGQLNKPRVYHREKNK